MWLKSVYGKAVINMKNIKNSVCSVVAFIMLIITAISVTVISAFAADSAFEKQISGFPESYKPYLRELHSQYPKWKFVPFNTGLDWETVIDNEHDDYALVYRPDTARIFMSLDPDDYDAENDMFYYKDGSFVAASRIAVEYFMDPRNFLDKSGIFQFELLNFSSLYTVDMVEAILYGSFMSESKMTYVDSKGKKHTDSMTYAQAIYKAGKTYNINPCFIASKILNEVGSRGSDSVSGTNDSYPGLYNFYNIGATDGAGAIERGLYWAGGSGEGRTSYMRPWTTPYRSIMGGAQFLAEEYIAAGQYTGYLQRFNVNPKSDYPLYSHQYMSNLSGALSQGHYTYLSYRSQKMLNSSLTFSIPVYKNMSDANGDGKLVGAESTEQYGKTNSAYYNVRTGPSVDHDILKDSSGKAVNIAKDQEVIILQKVDTDAYYYEEILAYPYWYRVSFKSNGKTYTGYIPGSKINISTAVYVSKGVTDIAFAKSSLVKNNIAFSKPGMVRIIDDNTVEFLKNGTVSLYIYDSYGHFEEILFKVGSYTPYYSSNVKAEISTSSITVSSSANSKAIAYGYSLADTSGGFTKASFTTKRTRTFDGIKSGLGYTVYAQNCYGKNIYSKAQKKSFVTKPAKVKTLDFTREVSGKATLKWSAVSAATGYQVLSYNTSTKKYASVLTVPFGKTSCTLTAKQAAANYFVVRAYTWYDSLTAYGTVSGRISLKDKPPIPGTPKISSLTSSGFTVSWQGHKDCAGYEIYLSKADSNKFTLYKTVTGTSLKISGFKEPVKRVYKVRSYVVKSGKKVYSSFTSAVAAITLPKTVTGVKVSTGSTSATVSWNAVSGAKYYNLHYANKNGGALRTVKVNGTSHKLTGLRSYNSYYFAVSATAVCCSKTVTGNNSAAVTVTTKPKVPTGLKVSFSGYNHIDLSWTADKTLDSYRVYYYSSSGKLLGNKVIKKGNTVRISGLSKTTSYKFRIRGYKLVGKEYVASDYSGIVSGKTAIPTVSGIKASAVKAKSVRLSWTKLEGAACYNVYYYTGGKYKKVLKPTTNYCDITFIPVSSKGTFYLTATFGKGDNAVESKPTSKFTTSVLPSKVSGISVKPSLTSAKVTWEKVKNASGYNVYLLSNGKYVLKKTLTSNSYNLTGLKQGEKYTVSVRAFIRSTTGTVLGEHSAKSFYTTVKSVSNISQTEKSDTSYKLTWDSPSSYVNTYLVYRYDEEAGKYKRIAITGKPELTVKNIIPGTSQKYTVVAGIAEDGKLVAKSAESEKFICSTNLSRVTNLTFVKANTQAVKFRWDEVPGATEYRVYLYNEDKKKFEYCKTVVNTETIVKGLSSEKSYTFRVAAVRIDGENTIRGDYSSNLRTKTL